jgi:hypothetical protein
MFRPPHVSTSSISILDTLIFARGTPDREMVFDVERCGIRRGNTSGNTLPVWLLKMEKGIVSESCLSKRIDHTYVWVVKIWFEAPASPETRPFWRGHVKDVLTNEELYFQSLDELKAFIAKEITQ